MPEKVRELQALFDTEAKKYNVLPLDNTTLLRWNTPRPSLQLQFWFIRASKQVGDISTRA
jgi:hypothetical protein